MKIFTTFLLLLCFYGIRAQQLSVVDAQSDIRQLELALTQYHPDLYRYISQEDFKQRISLLKTGCIDGITVEKLYKKSIALVNSIRDGHLFIFPSNQQLLQEAGRSAFLPFSVKIIDYKIFIDKSLVPQFNKWDLITAINGVNSSDILYQLLPSIPTDGYSINRKTKLLEQNFAVLYNRFIGGKQFDIEYITKDSKNAKSNLLVEGVKASKWKGLEIPKEVVFQIEKERELAYFKLPTFNATQLAESLSWKKLLKSKFKALHKLNIQSLILDLRDNNGGSVTTMVELAQYLAAQPFKIYNKVTFNAQVKHDTLQVLPTNLSNLFQSITTNHPTEWNNEFTNTTYQPSKKRFTNKLYILVDGGTFSSAAHLVAILKDQDAIIIGQETGGNAVFSNAGYHMNTTLTKSNLRLQVPLLHGAYFTSSPKTSTSGILPNIICGNDLRNNIFYKDYCLLRTLELIKKDKKK